MLHISYLCVHCHFYQPPRGDALNGGDIVEPEAAPYRNWNERITAECYEPNARIGNFERISFNIGETLATWLAANSPETYRRIIEADASNVERYKVGNAIAQPMHHTILPLARRDDKVTQVLWGKMVFARRFGRQTSGMWLPEMAVDFETLEVLADQGIKWTILTESQVEGKLSGAGPYWVRLPSGRMFRVFVRDEKLSNDIAFNLGHFGGAGRWAREVLLPRKRSAGTGPLGRRERPTLTLVATDGETFGHHWPGEEQFLHWLLSYEALGAGYEPITLSKYAELVEPIGEVALKENTSWSCSHGVARWATGCACTPGDSYWKGAVRRAQDVLRIQLDAIYTREVTRLGAGDPLALRNAYIAAVLGDVPRERFLNERGIRLNKEAAERLLKLVEAQYYLQCMYASCTYFFPDLDALTTRYGITNAARAIQLTREATGEDLSAEFRADLKFATALSQKTNEPITGADLFDEAVQALAALDLKQRNAPQQRR